MKNILKGLSVIILFIIIVYLLGPKAPKANLDPMLPTIDASLENIEAYVADQESKVENIRPNNAASIVWADSSKQKTDFVVVYLHGFSASAMEGHPLHVETAKRYGYNLYLPRLYDHGIKRDDIFIDFTPEKLLNSAKEAIAVAKILGDSIILMSCSTGGTLSLYLAAHHPEIHSLIAYSPNIDIADNTSSMLVKPWGLQLARKAMGDTHREYEATEEMKKYWTNRYRIEGLVALKSFINASMRESTFAAVNQPVFIGYYYKNEEEQDHIISIPRIHEMFDQLGTVENLKMKIAFPETGNHVINSPICSDDISRVRSETFKFCDEVLGLKPKITILVENEYPN